VKALAQMPHQNARQHLVDSNDCATRWVYLEILHTKCTTNAAGFLEHLLKVPPSKVVTDSGNKFSGRLKVIGQRDPTHNQPFQVRPEHAACHRLFKARDPRTNVMVANSKRHLPEMLNTNRCDSGEHMRNTLRCYVWLCNRHTPQRGLEHSATVKGLEGCYRAQPDMLPKRPCYVPGLDA
jgi:hypothetical protein